MKKIFILLFLLMLCTPAEAEYSSGTSVLIHNRVISSIPFPMTATSNCADCSAADYILVEATGSANYVIGVGVWSQTIEAYATQATWYIATGGMVVSAVPSYGYSNVFVYTERVGAASPLIVYVTPLDHLQEQELGTISEPVVVEQQYRHETWYDANP